MNFLGKFSELNNDLMKKFFKVKKTKKFFDVFEILMKFLNFNSENNENLFKQQCYTLIFFYDEINLIFENSSEKNKFLIEEKINFFINNNNKKFENSKELNYIKNLFKNFFKKNKNSKENENKIFCDKNQNEKFIINNIKNEFNNNFVVNNNNEIFIENINNIETNFEKKKIKKIEEKKVDFYLNKNLNSQKKKFNLKPKNKTEKKFYEFIIEIKNFSSIFEYLIKNNNQQENELFQKFEIKILSDEFKFYFLSLSIFLFPFFSLKHKENLINFLKNNFNNFECFKKIFIKENLFQKYFFSLISNQNLNLFENDSKKNFNNLILSFENENNLIEKFIFLIILKILEINLDCLIIQKLIFFIQFILRNYLIFNLKNINNIFYIFYFFKQFFSDFNINFKNNFIIEEKNKNFFYQTNNEILFLNFEQNQKKIEIKDLFSQNEINFYFNIINKISHFYQFNSKNLLNFENFYNIKFLENQIELFYYKQKFITNNKKKYIKNLIQLETDLIKIHVNNEKNYNIDPEKKNIFNDFKNKLFSYFQKENYNYNYYKNNQFNLFPYGSITQFVDNNKSDLDIYLKLNNKNRKKSQTIQKIFDFIQNNIDKKVTHTISQRVCVIKFIYKHLEFDLSLLGFCPYLHSNLIRKYSLLDGRFPILARGIKKLIEILGLNNTKTRLNYLNSFSWMLLLITFLQDIIYPPVLPKLLNHSKSTNVQVEFGRKNNEKFFIKNFENFVENIVVENVKIPADNLKNFKDLYENQIKIKNKMSCSEIFLKFLEFVIFYFKYDSIFVNSGYCEKINEGECFKNKNLINNFDKDEKDFYNYYVNKYNIYNKMKDEIKIDGFILLRDPFDSHYNPGQSLKEINIINFIHRLKIGYFTLLETGKFSEVEKKIKNEKLNNF